MSNKNDEAKQRGVIARQQLYSIVSKYTVEAIEKLVNLMRNANQDSVQMAAANALLNKILPDIKAVEISGENNEPTKLFVNMGGGFIPASLKLSNPSIQENSTNKPKNQGRYIFGEKQVE